jgi:hypothetical protein
MFLCRVLILLKKVKIKYMCALDVLYFKLYRKKTISKGTDGGNNKSFCANKCALIHNFGKTQKKLSSLVIMGLAF